MYMYVVRFLLVGVLQTDAGGWKVHPFLSIVVTHYCLLCSHCHLSVVFLICLHTSCTPCCILCALCIKVYVYIISIRLY